MSNAKALQQVVLRDLKDKGGPRFMDARRRKDGVVVISGHDLGPGVARVFGPGLTEYEWVWTLEPQDVPAAVSALGGLEGDDPLRVLGAWSADHAGDDPGSYLKDAGVPIGFWNRIGD